MRKKIEERITIEITAQKYNVRICYAGGHNNNNNNHDDDKCLYFILGKLLNHTTGCHAGQQ